MASTIAKQIIQKQRQLAEVVIELQYARQPKIWQPYAGPKREKSIRDAGYHLLYLAEALQANDEALFTEYLAWVKSLFKSLSFPDDVLTTSLDCTRQALSAAFKPQEIHTALRLIEIGEQSLAQPLPDSTSYLGTQDLLANQFLGFLLAGNRQNASRLILEAVQNKKMTVQEVYLNVFQKTQREIGRLWQTNQISVAQEHFCTAATQMIMSQLYPYIFNGARKDHRLVMACVGGELHEIGARMVADFFEMHGWDTYFLGANTPPESILKTAQERNADILGLSVTMTFHIETARSIIETLRQKPNNKTRVWVGGYPFNLSPQLWQKIGADGYAPDAESALQLSQGLIQ